MRIIILLAFLTISCTKDKILYDETKGIHGDNFYNALASGYNELAKRERDLYDWADTDVFAKKGLKSIKRQYVSPENPLFREIPDNFMLDELIIAHNSMLNIFSLEDNEVKFNYPLKAARLQVLYDYWVEQAEENWQNDEISRFRQEYWDTYDSLYAAIVLSKAEREKTIINKNFFTIYFDHDMYTLDKEATREVNNAVFRIFSKAENYSLVLEGHTDLSGKKEYNLNLAHKRIKSVKEYLISKGIPKDAFVKEQVYGQNKPAIIKEAGGNRERLNRRVEIYILSKKLRRKKN